MRKSFQEIPKLQVVAAGHGAYNFKGVCIQSTIFFGCLAQIFVEARQPAT